MGGYKVKYKKVNKVYITFALKRSGQHAILEWIRKSLDSPIVFYNNIKPVSNNLHYCSLNYMIDDKVVEPFTYKGQNLYRCVEPQVENLKEIPREVNSIIISFEEWDLTNFTNGLIKQWCDILIDDYTEIIPIIIQRDIFNIAGSREVGRKSIGLPFGLDYLSKFWSIYSSYILHQNFLSNTIPVLYDKWVTDKAYREVIANKLKLDNKNVSTNNISPIAPSSSFNPKNINQQKYYTTDRKKFLNRWRYCSLNVLNQIVDNPLVIKQTKQLFGKTTIEEIKHYLKTLTKNFN